MCLRHEQETADISYAAAAAACSLVRPTLNAQNIVLDWGEVGRTGKLMRKKEEFIYLSAPPGAAEGVVEGEVLFGTMTGAVRRVEGTPVGELQKVFASMPDEVRLVTGAEGRGRMELKFEGEDVTGKCAMSNLHSEGGMIVPCVSVEVWAGMLHGGSGVWRHPL